MPTPRDVVRYIQYVAANIRITRRRRRMTQEQLAEAAEVDLKNLQKIEAAKVNPSLSTVVCIALALNTSPAQLLRPAVMPPVRRGRPSSKR